MILNNKTAVKRALNSEDQDVLERGVFNLQTLYKLTDSSLNST